MFLGKFYTLSFILSPARGAIIKAGKGVKVSGANQSQCIPQQTPFEPFEGGRLDVYLYLKKAFTTGIIGQRLHFACLKKARAIFCSCGAVVAGEMRCEALRAEKSGSMVF